MISLLVTIIIISISCYIYDFELKILLFEKLNLHPFDKQLRDTEKEYDIFLLYNRDDEVWVVNTLRVGLEEFGYKLCIGARDFTVGAANTAELANALTNSHRVIVVVSQSFINNDRDMSDFYHACEYQSATTRQRFIILVKIRERLNFRDHDVLKTYLSTNYFVPIRARRFWPRLRYWLPPLQKKRIPASTDNIDEEEEPSQII